MPNLIAFAESVNTSTEWENTLETADIEEVLETIINAWG